MPGRSQAWILLCLTPSNLNGGTISGTIQTATSGTVNYGTLTFNLSQPIMIPGTGLVTTSQVNCYTSAVGSVVGVRDPVNPTTLSANLSSGTLGAGPYYVKYAYWNATGISIASGEASFTLSGTGTLIVSAPSIQPTAASGYKVYIGATKGSESAVQVQRILACNSIARQH